MWLEIKKNWKSTTAVALLSATLVAAAPIFASTVTSPSDDLSTEEAGVAANHNLFFTISSGVTENKIITLTFSGDFNTASLIEDDIDVTDDGVDLTTAANCSGTDKASIAIASDIVTITICAGDGGAITAGSIVGVEIGTNATSSGTGANQITNPTGAGTYFITIGGDFGDTGSIAVPIISDGSVGVTGTVSGGGGGSPGPAPESCTDVITPVISSLSVSEITTTSAVITWTTDEATNSLVSYGLTASYELAPLINSSFSTTHSIALTGLNSGGIYHYSVTSADFCGNSVSSSDTTFTTIDVVAPIISGIGVLETTTSSARVIWNTNEMAIGRFEYGETTAYGSEVLLSDLDTSFSTTLTGLSENTVYHFKITATDSSNNSAVSTDQTFTTLSDVAPSNVSNFTAVAGNGQINLSWINPTDTDLAGVVIIFCLDGYPISRFDSRCTQIYNSLGTSYVHTGLRNGLNYFYGAFSYDVGGHIASGALTSATPIGEIPDVCGDEICGGTESSDSCLIDCPEIPVPTEAPTATCGDGICGANESSFVCFVDCGETPTPTNACGDSVCDETESSTTCSTDCDETTTSETTCGNAVCDSGETNETCVSDCPSIEIPETTVTETEEIPSSDVSFIGAEIIDLNVDSEGVIDFLTGSKISVIVSEANIVKEVTSIHLAFGSETYLLSSTDGAYRADVTTPGTSTRHALSVVINYTDGTAQTLSFIANLLGSGLVYEKIDEQVNSISGASVELLRISGHGDFSDIQIMSAWNGSQWNQFNPITTNDSGTFAWYVENGSYKVTVSKNGYENIDSGTIVITNNIVNPRIEIKKIEEIPVTNITSVAAVVVETFQSTVESVTEIISGVGEISQTVRESPAAQTVASTSAPIVATTVVASTIMLATTFDLLPFLQLLFTSPLLLFGRRKRKAYGVVYHAFTKKPIDLATVRLYQLPENKLIMSRVTDKGGRYFFMTKPGNYRVEVIKSDFVFPAQTMKEIKDDAIYLDVYHGEQVEVSEKNTIITPNIPLEPTEASQTKTPKEIQKKQMLRRLQKWLSLTGILISVYVFWIQLSILSGLLLGLQITVYLLIRRLATTPKPKSWGIVYDKNTDRPLSKVVVRLFEPKYHKLLETGVTDNKGRYAFIIGPNEYSTTYEKTGYQTAEIQPIDLTKNKDVAGWAQDLKLEPINNFQTNSKETK